MQEVRCIWLEGLGEERTAGRTKGRADFMATLQPQGTHKGGAGQGPRLAARARALTPTLRLEASNLRHHVYQDLVTLAPSFARRLASSNDRIQHPTPTSNILFVLAQCETESSAAAS